MTKSPDYIDSSKKAYYLWHNGGIKTNLDSWLNEAKTEADKEKVINNVTWLIGRVVDNTSYNPHLLGKYKTDGSDSDFISSLKYKTIEGNTYISSYSCVNYVSYYLNESLSPLNETYSSKWLFTSLGSDLYTIQINNSDSSYLVPNGSSIKLSSESKPWKLYKAAATTYDGLNTYLIQNVSSTSYLAFNVNTGAINYWKKEESNTWKKTWVIADKPYCTTAPKPSIDTNLILNSYCCINGTNQNVLRTYTNVGINLVDGTTYSDRTYYDFCYNKSDKTYAIYNTGDHTYLTATSKDIATTSFITESRWKCFNGSARVSTDLVTYSVLQNADSLSYMTINLSSGDIIMTSEAQDNFSYSSRFVIRATHYYVPTTAAPTTAAPTTAAPTTAAPTTAAPTTAAPTTAAPTALYYGIYRYINIGTGKEKALMMPVVRAVSAEDAQTAFEKAMINYEKYYYKPASSDDYSESKMANYTYMKQHGTYNYLPSWSGGDLDGIVVSWRQVPS